MFDSINWIRKLPFLVVFLMLAFFVLTSLRFAFKTDLTYEEKACIFGGGSWELFPSTCKDDCGGAPPPGNIRVCGAMITPGCYCGPDKCWDSIKQHCR